MPGTWSDFAQGKRLADRPLIGADRPPLTSLLFSKKKDFSQLLFALFQKRLALMHAMQLFEQSGTIEPSSK